MTYKDYSSLEDFWSYLEMRGVTMTEEQELYFFPKEVVNEKVKILTEIIQQIQNENA